MAILCICAFLAVRPVSAQDLPPDILADQYLLEAIKDLESGNGKEAIRRFRKIEALNTATPPYFKYSYGKTLAEYGSTADDLLKGKQLLTEYVLDPDKNETNYRHALEWLSEINRRFEELLAAGVSLYSKSAKRDDKKKAFNLIQQVAKSNHSLAVMWLARTYYRGRMDVPKDVDQGQRLARSVISEVKELADANDPEALFLLGSAYHDGMEVPKNNRRSCSLYLKAAELGHAIAQNNLGICYYHGKGMTKNYSEAFRWFRKSAEQGDFAAYFALGHLYKNGRGVSQNDAEAVIWFRKAVNRGYSEARKPLEELEEKQLNLERERRNREEERKRAERRRINECTSQCDDWLVSPKDRYCRFDMSDLNACRTLCERTRDFNRNIRVMCRN